LIKGQKSAQKQTPGKAAAGSLLSKRPDYAVKPAGNDAASPLPDLLTT
jgi:hypothetical protein